MVSGDAAAAAVANHPDLSIHFQRAGEEVFAKTIARSDLPLAVGDKVQFFAKLPKPMYAYVYWVASDGDDTEGILASIEESWPS